MTVVARRHFREWEIIAVLIHQGVAVPCFRCREPLPLPTRPNMVQREHIHEIALGGPDIPANCRFSHHDCHATITNGTPATSAGSSKHRIAKVNRLIGKPPPKHVLRAYCTRCKTEFDPDELHECKSQSPRRRSPWPKGRKIQNRGFQKAVRT